MVTEMADRDDLLEDEEETGKKKKKKKEKKPKKEKKAGKAPDENGEKPRKKGSSVLGFLVGFLFVLVLVAGFVVFIYFENGEIKGKVNELLNMNERAYAAEWSILEDEQSRLAEERKAVEAQKQKNEDASAALMIRESLAAEKETQAEQALKNATELRDKLSIQSAELDKTVQLLSKMDATAAAEILESMDDRSYVMMIFRNMGESVQTALLAEFSTEFATDILTRMGTGS
ncbi:hypothetical protein LJC32_01540 [Oscillospiraceae bacterium OttesenSCG-928-F05]|nr:hypothetical protein [Oscillospiraceae bacterium OttesenSCG-928-F05]